MLDEEFNTADELAVELPDEAGALESLEGTTSATGALGVMIFPKSSSEEHPENKHTTPTHPKNVVIFFMLANIVYILALH